MNFELKRNVVVVDDDAFMRVYLSETLAAAGYGCKSFPDGAAALGWLAAAGQRTDLLLSDINMPGMSGLDLVRTVKMMLPDVPFILISGLCNLPMAHAALRAGASDYLLKPVRPADLLGLVSRHLDVNFSEQFEAVRNALKRSLSERHSRGSCPESCLLPIFDALGFKRFETLQHSRRVAAFSLLIARGLGWSSEALGALETGSLLHDIGKVGIPHNVLTKPGKLTGEEWKIMKMHPRLGLELLDGLPGLEQEAHIVYSHHERFDGSGYPQQLSGDAIPLNARAFSVADTLDALTTDRCYRPGMALPEARTIIRSGAGSQFDPVMVTHLEHVPDRELQAIRMQFPESHWILSDEAGWRKGQ